MLPLCQQMYLSVLLSSRLLPAVTRPKPQNMFPRNNPNSLLGHFSFPEKNKTPIKDLLRFPGISHLMIILII